MQMMRRVGGLEACGTGYSALWIHGAAEGGSVLYSCAFSDSDPHRAVLALRLPTPPEVAYPHTECLEPDVDDRSDV